MRRWLRSRLALVFITDVRSAYRRPPSCISLFAQTLQSSPTNFLALYSVATSKWATGPRTYRASNEHEESKSNSWPYDETSMNFLAAP